MFLITAGTINGKHEDEGRQDGSKEGLLIALSLFSIIAGRFLLSGLDLGYLSTFVGTWYVCSVLFLVPRKVFPATSEAGWCLALK